MGRFRLMLWEELKGGGKYSSFSTCFEVVPAVAEERKQTLAFFDAFDGME